MTVEEFMNSRFGAGDKVKYKGVIYTVYSTDFEEALFAIDVCDDFENLSWVRCDNVEFIPFINAKSLS